MNSTERQAHTHMSTCQSSEETVGMADTHHGYDDDDDYYYYYYRIYIVHKFKRARVRGA